MTELSQAVLSLAFGFILCYSLARCIYLKYFHPLAQFPGPPIAAVSNVWYAYHWLSGRYPWAMENAQQVYGDFVRIAPNELLFATSQASIDIYTPHAKNHESFIKSDINDRGDEHGGILFERDPARHRLVAKQLAPAFSSRASMAKVPVIHMYIDAFVDAIGTMAQQADGIDVSKWCNWLAMDTSAELTYNRKMHELKDMKNSAYLEVLLGFNAFTTLEQVSKRFPYISRVIKPALFTHLPESSLKSIPEMTRTSREEVQRRIRQKGNTAHLDFFEQLVPAGDPIPSDPKEMRHLEQVASQLLFAGYEPISSWYYSTLFFLLNDHAACQTLAAEIRGTFKSYKDISVHALASLKYLNACLEESLRLFPSNNTGLPRISPGAVVDGKYIPQGVYCQTSIFAASRKPETFVDPLQFRPQRWLPTDHPLCEERFSNDNTKGLFPFSHGPRVCPGKEIAWMQARLFISKVLWSFDLADVAGQELNFERDFVTYGFWVKPKLMIRFLPVSRDE